MHNHFIRTKATPDITDEDLKFIYGFVQAESLMDLEGIYQEMKIFCRNHKIECPRYLSVLDSLKHLSDMDLISEITGKEINLMLLNKRLDKMDDPLDTWGGM
jgi:hypothetical protein